MERSHEEEWVEGKCRKDKGIICGTGLDLLQSSCEYPCAVCGTGVLATTSSTAMAANSGCIKNAAGYNECHQILIIDVHGAGELPALLMEDCRVRFSSDLISWRW